MKQKNNSANRVNNLRSKFFAVVKIWDKIFGTKNQLTMLAYHGISESSDLYSVSLSDFKNQIDKLKLQYKFVSIEEVLKAINSKELKGLNLVLTFDDGYENILEVAPFIKKNKIPATLFVLSDSQNANRKELANTHKFLSTAQIKSLKKQGWTIGCHSATHSDFSKLSKSQMSKEIINSKKTLEQKLGFKIEYFAFPKGRLNNVILEMVEKAGYKAAFATTPGSVKKGISKFVIPRTVIDKSYALNDFPIMLSEIIYFIRSTFSSLISKLY